MDRLSWLNSLFQEVEDTPSLLAFPISSFFCLKPAQIIADFVGDITPTFVIG